MEQAIFTTIILSQNSRLTPDHSCRLLSRLQRPQTRPRLRSIFRQTPYHLFLLLRMDRQAMAPELRNMVHQYLAAAEEDFAVEGATMIARVESPKTGRGPSILYQTAHLGC